VAPPAIYHLGRCPSSGGRPISATALRPDRLGLFSIIGKIRKTVKMLRIFSAFLHAHPLNQRAPLCSIAERADMAIAAGAPMSVLTYRAR